MDLSSSYLVGDDFPIWKAKQVGIDLEKARMPNISWNFQVGNEIIRNNTIAAIFNMFIYVPFPWPIATTIPLCSCKFTYLKVWWTIRRRSVPCHVHGVLYVSWWDDSERKDRERQQQQQQQQLTTERSFSLCKLLRAQSLLVRPNLNRLLHALPQGEPFAVGHVFGVILNHRSCWLMSYDHTQR